MKKLVVFAVCAIMALAVMVPFGKVFGADPIGDPPDPADQEFVSIETLPQSTNKLLVSSLKGKITIENPDDPESKEAPQIVKYGFIINFPGYQETYPSWKYWADDGEISSVGDFTVSIKKQRDKSEPFATSITRILNDLSQRAGTPVTYFQYIFYVNYTKQDKNGNDVPVWKYAYKDGKEGEWFVFDISKAPKPVVPKDSIVSSKIFSIVDSKGKATNKFEVSYDVYGNTQLNWIKARIKAVGAQGDFKAHFEFYSSDAEELSTKDINGEYLINKDGTFLVGFKESEDENPEAYGFDAFWQESLACAVYVRCTIEDKDEKVVFRSKYFVIRQSPR